ncbi:MAG: SCP2 sterol-binding domain-containing protein [Gammaproteobacteria bacterium]|nr:SCP2 sterol-binding domain-containing protein [Gammaproteobacteria bacterium]
MNKKKLFNSTYFAGICKIVTVSPISVVQITSNQIIKKIIQNHDDIKETLEEYDDPTFLIIPTDFPLIFKLRPCGENSYLTAYKKNTQVQADATIKGNSEKLFDLMEGKVDGDALFFSREISISGKTEAVVALRNAIENAEIDIFEEILESCKPLKKAMSLSNNIHTFVKKKIDSEFQKNRDFLLAPVTRKLDKLEEKLNLIEHKND